MSIALDRNDSAKKKIYTTEEVRNILNTDNKGISQLCKQVYVSPKKDKRTGQTFFLDSDVEILKKINSLHSRGQKIMESKNLDSSSNALIQRVESVVQPRQEVQSTPAIDVSAITKSIVRAQEGIVDKISVVIDEKLEGLDEVVVELIRCKTDIERQRTKIDDLTRDNYKLKSELEKFQSVGLGFYIKKNGIL